LEIAIDQNRKQGAAICRECFNALRVTEVLAFDLLIVDYFLGNATSAQISAYVESCVRPQFSLMPGDPREIEAFAEHIRSVQLQIQASIANLPRSDSKKIDPLKRNSELITFLNEQKQRCESDQKGEEKAQRPPVEIHIDLPGEDPPDDTRVDAEFADWLKRQLRPGADAVDLETAEFRALFGTVVHRLQAVSALRSELSSLRSSQISTRNLQYTDCSPETIYRSPFFRAAQNNCRFLAIALKSIAAQKELVPACATALAQCRAHLESLRDKCAETMTQMLQCREYLDTTLAQRRTDVDQLSQELRPYAEALCFDITTCQLDEMVAFTTSLDTDIESRFKKVMGSFTTDLENRFKIENQLKLLFDLRSLRSATTAVCQKSFETIKASHAAQLELFRAVSDFCKAEEIVRLHQREIERMTTYHQHLTTVIDLMKADQIADWCAELTEVSGQIAAAIAEQKEIQAAFEPLLSDDLGRDEVARMNDDVEALMAVNARLVEEEAVLECQIVDAEEELFQVLQELECFKDVDEDDDEQELQARVICPVCRENERNCILAGCGHPVCRQCIAAAKEAGKCPVCSAQFGEADVRPFILQWTCP
jgi:hypothetical protein